MTQARVALNKNDTKLIASLIRTKLASLPMEDDADHITRQAFRDAAFFVERLGDPENLAKAMAPGRISS